MVTSECNNIVLYYTISSSARKVYRFSGKVFTAFAGGTLSYKDGTTTTGQREKEIYFRRCFEYSPIYNNNLYVYNNIDFRYCAGNIVYNLAAKPLEEKIEKKWKMEKKIGKTKRGVGAGVK